MTRQQKSDMLVRDSLYLLGLIMLMIILITIGRQDETDAVCTTDADCAQWEIDNDVPMSERCFGAPCPAKETK